MRSARELFDEYAQSHRNPVNERIHWICVPAILFSAVALLWSLPVPAGFNNAGAWLNWGVLCVAAAQVYYFVLSPKLGAGMLGVNLVFLWLCRTIATHSAVPVWRLAGGVFVAAWIGQFIGHQVEGRKPSFFKDLQFLLIGPAWLLDRVYRRLGVSY